MREEDYLISTLTEPLAVYVFKHKIIVISQEGTVTTLMRAEIGS
jgi:hypothetical protein